jgi:hypothetical protein
MSLFPLFFPSFEIYKRRLQDEIARVEDELIKPSSIDMLLKCFVSAKANSFENLLDPFLKICRISIAITIGIAKATFFKRIIDRLSSHSKAVVRLNLLRILRTVCDVHPNRAILVERYGLHEIVKRLSRDDGAVLVRELAREIVPALTPALKPASGKSMVSEGGKSGNIIAPKRARRTASETSAIVSSAPISDGGHSTTRPEAGGNKMKLPSRLKLGDIPWQTEGRR